MVATATQPHAPSLAMTGERLVKKFKLLKISFVEAAKSVSDLEGVTTGEKEGDDWLMEDLIIEPDSFTLGENTQDDIPVVNFPRDLHMDLCKI